MKSAEQTRRETQALYQVYKNALVNGHAFLNKRGELRPIIRVSMTFCSERDEQQQPKRKFHFGSLKQTGEKRRGRRRKPRKQRLTIRQQVETQIRNGCQSAKLIARRCQCSSSYVTLILGQLRCEM
jgi:hypothetical protein